MTKKLIISLMLFGLVAGMAGVSAQSSVSVQPGTVAQPAPLIFSGSTDTSAVPEVNLRPGMRSADVRTTQEILRSLGYFPSNIETTEYLGQKTKEAIINFQRDNGLPASGFFGPATRAAMKKSIQVSTGAAVIDSNVDIACMKIAVEKRENALLSTYDVYSGKHKTARETRKTELLAAWSVQDPQERYAAVKAAWDKFHQSNRTATSEGIQSRATIWIQFAQDAKNCNASAVETQNLEKTTATGE